MHLMFILVTAFAVSFCSHAATVPTAPPTAAAAASGAANTTDASAATGATASAANSSAATTTPSNPCANQVCANDYICQVNLANQPMCVPPKDSIFWLGWLIGEYDD